VGVQISESGDASQMEVEVFETAFGKTLLNHDAHGTEFFNAKGPQWVMCRATSKSLKWVSN